MSRKSLSLFDTFRGFPTPSRLFGHSRAGGPGETFLRLFGGCRPEGPETPVNGCSGLNSRILLSLCPFQNFLKRVRAENLWLLYLVGFQFQRKGRGVPPEMFMGQKLSSFFFLLTVGSFLLTFELVCLQLRALAFLLTIRAFLRYSLELFYLPWWSISAYGKKKFYPPPPPQGSPIRRRLPAPRPLSLLETPLLEFWNKKASTETHRLANSDSPYPPPRAEKK